MILQPQSDIPHFRRFVRKIGWQITEEEMVLEDGKFYPMMKAIRNLKCNESWTPLEEMFGKYLLQEKNQVLYHYLQRESRIRSQILEQLEAAPKAEAVTARILEVKEEAQLIAAALAEYEG